MILIDEQENAAANRAAIRDAFQGHAIALGSAVMLAPQLALAGSVPSTARAAKKPTLAPATKRDLLRMMGAESEKLVVSAVKIAGNTLNAAIHQRIVPLDAVHKKLKGVVAAAPQVALLGAANDAPAIVGHVSNAEATVKDVETYVDSLVKHGRVAFEPKKQKPHRRAARAVASPTAAGGPGPVTHEVHEIRGQKTLVRVRFACRLG
jgi:hypothetical protein